MDDYGSLRLPVLTTNSGPGRSYHAHRQSRVFQPPQRGPGTEVIFLPPFVGSSGGSAASSESLPESPVLARPLTVLLEHKKNKGWLAFDTRRVSRTKNKD